MPEIMGLIVPKSRILKSSIFSEDGKKAFGEMKNSSKVSNRLQIIPRMIPYIHCLSFPQTNIWIMYRAKPIAGVKARFKQLYKDSLGLTLLIIRYIWRYVEGQRMRDKGLDMARWRGILIFWRMMAMKLKEETRRKRKNEVLHQQNQ